MSSVPSEEYFLEYEICECMKGGDADIQQATSQFSQCRDNICSQCCGDRRRFKKSENHAIVELNSQDELITSLADRCCDRNTNERFKTYFRDSICKKSLGDDHSRQRVSDVEDLIDKMNDCLHKVQDKASDLEDQKTRCMELVMNTEEAIFNRGLEIKKLVDRCTRSLLLQLQSIKDNALKDLGNEVSAIEKQKVSIESFKTYCTCLRDEVLAGSACPSIDHLNSMAEELQQLNGALTEGTVSDLEISFQVSAFKYAKDCNNIIGAIEVNNVQLAEDERREEETEENVSINEVYEFNPGDSHLGGVAKLEDSIFILNRNPNSITVYGDRSPFPSLEVISLEEIIDPDDIVTCDEVNCIYIPDSGANCIWKIKRNGTTCLWVTTCMCYANWPLTLSVSSDGHLLLLKDGVRSVSQLEIYSGAHAELIRNLLLPSDIKEPLRAIQKPNCEIIISHRLREATGAWVISLLNTRGEITKRFCPKESLHKLNNPGFISLDSDRLFVSDFYNHRVIMLDSNCLTWRQVVVTEEDIGNSQPFRLLYDGDKNLLFVGLCDGTVHVYELSYEDKTNTYF